MLRVTAFLLMITLLLSAGLRSKPIPEFFSGQDKLEHVLGFFCFGSSMLMLRRSMTRPAYLTICTGLAVLVEIVQAWLPQRTPSIMDAVAGMFGGWLAWRWMRRLI